MFPGSAHRSSCRAWADSLYCLKTTIKQISKIRRRLYRHDLKINQIFPGGDPRIQRFPIRRFHDLTTAGALCVNPTGMVYDAFEEHPAESLEAFANRLRIGVLEMFDDHEQHALCRFR